MKKRVIKLLLMNTIITLLQSCSILFPKIPELNENIVTSNVDDSLSNYFNELDSPYIYIANQVLKNPETFDLSVNENYLLSPDSSKAAYIYEEDNWEFGYHEIRIRDINKKITTSVCVIREGDPGSGFSHVMFWSSDSKVLLIKNYVTIDGVSYYCIIYKIENNILYNVSDEFTNYVNNKSN